METAMVGGTAEYQHIIETTRNRNNQARENAQSSNQQNQRAISERVDQVEINSYNNGSTVPSEPDVVVVEEKDMVKEMFLNAESHQQVEMATTQLQKSQMEAYANSYRSTNGEETSKSDPKIYNIKTPTFYDKVAEQYQQNQNEAIQQGGFNAVA